MKGTRTKLHHLFKSDLKQLLKNVSFRKHQPIIEKIDHTHFFHSINSQMKDQAHSSTICGHFHEITWKVVDGTPTVVKCGPAMVYRQERRPSGMKRVLSRNTFFDGENNREIVDEHTHEFSYSYSEEISEQSVRAVQADNFQTTAKSLGLEESDRDAV